jgi:ribosomal-protein-alanine N-acetyltransferase
MSAEPAPAPQASAANLPRWRVRPMIPADLATVMRIENQVYPFPWSAGNFSDSLKAGYDAWIFETARETIGYAILMWAPDEVHLLNISVAAESQGRGYGRAMLEWLCGDARGRGARALMLEVRPSNEHACALYRSMRFERIGVRKGYYPAHAGAREDALVLRKALTDE